MKKFIWIIFTIVLAFGLGACMPAGGGGGGEIIVGDQVLGGPVAQAPADAGAGGGQAVQGEQAAAQPQGGGMGDMFAMILPFILMFAVVYFLIMRPQRKQAKAVKEMQAALRTGDNIVTSSGFFGKIVSEGTDCFVVEFGEGGRSVKVPVRKTDISGVRSPVLTPPPKDGEIVNNRKK